LTRSWSLVWQECAQSEATETTLNLKEDRV